jgi:rRNA maturation endonuclease Nob1
MAEKKLVAIRARDLAAVLVRVNPNDFIFLGLCSACFKPIFSIGKQIAACTSCGGENQLAPMTRMEN